MKVAVLVTGLPRFVNEGAWWFNHKSNYPNDKYEMDFFVHSWADETFRPALEDAWHPKKIQIGYFDKEINEFIEMVREYNYRCDKLKYFNQNLNETIFFNTSSPSEYTKNFFGQYISAYRVTNMLKNYMKEDNLMGDYYDWIIRIRMDTIMHPQVHETWAKIFKILNSSEWYRSKVYTSWLHIKSSLPFIGDYVFISNTDVWLNYTNNFYDNLYNLLTKDKFLLYDLNFFKDMIAHYFWIRLAIYSKTSFVPITGIFPMTFEAILLREGINIPIEHCTYEDIKSNYIKDQAT
tara:strand:+ start:1399 stop:2274 length:876 start_codon:yes stop_codon:yes gene_type:complete